jgi:hypothetical protein
MSYLTIARIAGDPELLVEGYRQSSATMTDVGRDHSLILHVAARSDEGLLIVNLWPSRDGSRAAAADPRRLGVIREHGLESRQLNKEHCEAVNHVLFGSPESRGTPDPPLGGQFMRVP